MLKELYDYALENDLILPAGFVKKQVHAYVLLAKDGKFLGIMPGQEEKVPCPDIGSMAQTRGQVQRAGWKTQHTLPE